MDEEKSEEKDIEKIAEKVDIDQIIKLLLVKEYKEGKIDLDRLIRYLIILKLVS